MAGMLREDRARVGEEASVKRVAGLFRAPTLPLVIAGLLLSGCADSPGGPIPYNVSNFGVPDSPELVPLEAGYKIAPMDTLTVKVFKMPDLSGDYEVDLAGNISMPLIGETRAYDLTTAQLDDALTHRLGEKYLENPDVSVGIKSSTRRNVTVDGAVNKAGSYAVNGPTTLMQAVAAAGGASEGANVRRVAIFRTIGGQRQAAGTEEPERRPEPPTRAAGTSRRDRGGHGDRWAITGQRRHQDPRSSRRSRPAAPWASGPASAPGGSGECPGRRTPACSGHARSCGSGSLPQRGPTSA